MQWGVKSIKWVIFHFFIEAVSPCASETKTKTFPKTVATVVVPVHTQTHTGVCDVQISSFEMSELRLPKKPISRIFYCCNFAVCWLCLLLFSLLASSLSVPWLADQSSLLHIQFSSTLTVNEKWEPGVGEQQHSSIYAQLGWYLGLVLFSCVNSQFGIFSLLKQLGSKDDWSGSVN